MRPQHTLHAWPALAGRPLWKQCLYAWVLDHAVLPLWLLPLALALAATLFHLTRVHDEQLSLDNQLRQLEATHAAAVRAFHMGTEAHVFLMLQDENLSHWLASGLRDSPAQHAAAARAQVAALLAPSYRMLHSQGVSHLHLVRQDGISFLRMHRPDLHGDHIAALRPMIHRALLAGRALHGAEIGKDVAAFRFLHPLHHQGRLLGVADLAVPFHTLGARMRELDPHGSYDYLLDARQSRAVMNADARQHYRPSRITEQLLVDQRTASAPAAHEGHSPGWAELEEALRKSPALAERLAAGQPFALAAELAGGLRTAAFVPLRDPEGASAGWLVGSWPSPALEQIRREFLRNLLVAILLLSSLALVAWRLLRNRSTLEQERRLFRAITETMSDGLYVTDDQGRLRVANPAAARLLGYPEGTLEGRHATDFVIDDCGCDASTLAESALRRQDGSTFPAAISKAPLNTLSGSAAGCVNVFRDMSALKAHQAHLEHLALYDPLTGLPNRPCIQARLEKAIAAARPGGHQVALLLICLDRFKSINDCFGHDIGDELLALVAERFRALSEAEQLGRWGGGQFTLLMDHLQHEQDAQQAAEFILQLLESPFSLSNGQEVFLAGHVGISIHPRDGHSAVEIIRNADAALNQARQQGPHSYRMYHHSLTEDARRRIELDTLMRHALDNDEFELHYQPLVDAGRHTMVGVEALVRWRHPTLGMIPPGQFIPVAEQSGFIVPLGLWVMRTACMQYQRWRTQGLTLERLTVNLAPRQLAQPDLVDQLRNILALTGMPAERLELEITESAMMQHGSATIALLDDLRALGVHLSIDDFGTGYSSLAYLKRFPVTKLKVDQSFVRSLPDDRDDSTIVATVVAMGRSLGLEVLAEGVESKPQADHLKGLGCDTLQGFLFSPAVPGAELLRMVQDGRLQAAGAAPAPPSPQSSAQSSPAPRSPS